MKNSTIYLLGSLIEEMMAAAMEDRHTIHPTIGAGKVEDWVERLRAIIRDIATS